MRFLILSYLLVLELTLQGVKSADAMVESRKKAQCKNPKGKHGSSLLSQCGQSVCAAEGKKYVWRNCPQPAMEKTLNKLQERNNLNHDEVAEKLDQVMNVLVELMKKLDPTTTTTKTTTPASTTEPTTTKAATATSTSNTTTSTTSDDTTTTTASTTKPTTTPTKAATATTTSNTSKSNTTTSDVCVTALSGPNPGVPCVFPFNYGGQTHNKCTKLGHSGYWCATQTNSQGNYLAWGDCDCQKCPCIVKDTTTTTASTTKPTTTPTKAATATATSNTTKSNTTTSDVCVTALSGPNPGVPCVFPLNYGGQTHNKCTKLGHSGYWCATQTNSQGNYLAWGDCDCQNCTCSEVVSSRGLENTGNNQLELRSWKGRKEGKEGKGGKGGKRGKGGKGGKEGKGGI